VITFAIRNLLLTLAVTLAIAAAGVWAWTRVPVDAIPDLSDNQVIVWAEWPGKSPEDVDQQITSRLARDLQGLPGVTTVRGLSLYGTGYVYVIFDERRDLYDCRTRTLERLQQIQTQLPSGVQARLGPDASALGQVYAFTLQGRRDTEAKRYVLDQVVIPALQGVPGVAEIAPAGGVVREYQIDVDPDRLRAQGLDLDLLMEAVRQGGRDTGAMSIERTGIETMIRGIGFIRSARDVENIVLRGNAAGSAGLQLKDVATVHLGGALRQGLLADGEQEQVGAVVAMRVHEDPKRVIQAVKARLLALQPALAKEDLTPVPFYDRSQLIQETSQTLADTLVDELLVTCLVVVAFLLHARASLCVALSLPLGVAFTFLAMHLLGLSANIMSLAGIAIAVGVMVDFGIVVTENITQHLVTLQERRKAAGGLPPASPFDPEVVDAVIAGTREVSRALLTAAATTIIGFLPIFVLSDQAGRLFIPLALTKTLAISGAVLFGMLTVPVLCRLLLPPWQVRKPVVLACAALVAGAVFAWLLPAGVEVPREHGRWALAVPGWLIAPFAAALAGWIVWRLGRERLVNYEENPVSHGIHVAYDWAFTRIQRHKVTFTAVIAAIALTGWLLGVGWPTLSAPLRAGTALLGGDLAETRIDRALSSTFPGIGSSFLPPLDEGSLLFMPSLPATAGLGETLRVMQLQNRQITRVPEVAGVMGKMGRAESALDPAPIGMIETVVVLKPYREWPLHETRLADGSTISRPRTLAEVRAALVAISDIPGTAPSWLQPIETRVVMLSTGIRSLMALQLLGDDHEALERTAEQAEKILQQVPGAADVQMQREGGKPYVEIRLDQQRLARFGITTEQVMSAVETGLGGMPLITSVEGTQRYAVRLRYQREDRDDPDELALLQIPVRGAMGRIPLRSLVAAPVAHELTLTGITAHDWLAQQSLPLQRNTTISGDTTVRLVLPPGESLAAATLAGSGWTAHETGSHETEDGLTWTIGPMAIRSEGGKRTQYVLFNARGRAEVDVVQAADAALRSAFADGRVDLPKGTTFRWVGRYEQQVKAAAALRWVIAASVLIMIFLIYLGTRSALTTSIIISCNLTVTTAGGFIAVWLAGVEMTTAVVVGFLVLLGVMFNDGILLGTYLREQFLTPPRDVADLQQRIFIAGLRRRRPALMTNCTTLLSLIPVLWSEGRGAELMRPMVLPVIGGMIADLISLFSVPVFYAWWWERRLARDAADQKA
jgi:Cu(I)/Ag(I) efflux system membrane protein CusA/SilA